MAGAAPSTLGLGGMRLSTEADRDEEQAERVIAAAHAAGVRVFDTAPSYGHGEDDLHHNERLLGRALKGLPAFLSTKAGLTRVGTRWVVDGRRKEIVRSAELSAAALDRPIDLLLLHAVDPKVPLDTSLRALAELREAGVVRAIGICTSRRDQLEAALAHGATAVQLPLSVWDESALESGVLALALERGLFVQAHTPLGGPKRARGLDARLGELALRLGTTPVALALAHVVRLGAVPLVGATRQETAAALAAPLPVLDEGALRRSGEAPMARDAEVIVLVGSPGAGKSTLAASLEAEGFEVISRDRDGGTVRGAAQRLAQRLAERAASGERARIVVDNTHPGRVERARMLAAARGASVRAIVVDAPMPVRQANVVRRIVSVLGHLPEPEVLRRSKDPRVVPPSALFAWARAFEDVAEDEGFASIERRMFVRREGGTAAGLVIARGALSAIPSELLERAASGPTLVFGWAPDEGAGEGAGDDLRREVERLGLAGAELALCPHPAGPPVCWCRPPLPGLVVAWMLRHDVDPARATLVASPRDGRAIAEGTGMAFVPV